ncbi:hypothetical protein KAI37_02857 [Paenibacillus sp. S25]|nr:hypothetical protein KAI37_02857 [Paenibacillus sp. S25]
MSNGLAVFENQHEVTILTREDVEIDFKGDFLISAKDVATILISELNSWLNSKRSALPESKQSERTLF